MGCECGKTTPAPPKRPFQRDSGMTMLAMLDLAGLLIMTTIAQFLHRALFVHLLLQTAKSALNGLVLTAFDFRHLLCHPL